MIKHVFYPSLILKVCVHLSFEWLTQCILIVFILLPSFPLPTFSNSHISFVLFLMRWNRDTRVIATSIKMKQLQFVKLDNFLNSQYPSCSFICLIVKHKICHSYLLWFTTNPLWVFITIIQIFCEFILSQI